MTTTAEALELSIKHWEENVAVEKIYHARLGISSCALCVKFRTNGLCCFGCPVYEESGEIGCRETPYVEAHIAYVNRNLENFKIAAQKEVEFLKSLREDVK